MYEDTTSESDSSSFSFDAPPFSPILSASDLSEISLLPNEEQADCYDDVEEHDEGECGEEYDSEEHDGREQVECEHDGGEQVHDDEELGGREQVECEPDGGEQVHDGGEQLHDGEEPDGREQVECDPSVESAPVEGLPATVRNNSDRCTVFPLILWPGFKIVIDNVDKNLRPSYQRSDNKTISMHACNMYTCLDRINFSSLSDVKPSNPCIDVKTLLIGEADLDGLNSDVEVLLERYVVTQVVCI